MAGTLRLGQLFGIDIKIHFSWLFIFLLVAWSLADSYLPREYPGWDGSTYWGVGIAGSALLFVSVLIHELSHSLMAMSRGYRVSGITLFFLGGVSEIGQEPTSATQEFLIAVVGPLTSIVLGAIFFGLFQVATGGNAQLEALFGYLAIINLVLAVFNLVPAFPLDGGRVLKSVVWKVTGSLPKSITVATATGTLLGLGMIGAGITVAVVTHSIISGLWLVFIGWFIQSSASAMRHQHRSRGGLAGRLVRDAMQTEFPVVPTDTTVQALVEDYITREFHQVYVVALGESFEGVVTAADVRGLPQDQRSMRYVSEIMTRASSVATVPPNSPLELALQLLISNDLNYLVVADGDKPVGLLSREDILRVMEISKLFRSR